MQPAFPYTCFIEMISALLLLKYLLFKHCCGESRTS